MVEQVDHIGIAVRSLEDAIVIWRDVLGLELLGTEVVESQKVHVAMFRAGESRIELLQSTDPEGPIGRFVESKGEGIHHVALRVDDIAAALESAKEAGARLLNPEPVPGAHGAQVAFIHPASTGRVLVELCQPGVVH